MNHLDKEAIALEASAPVRTLMRMAINEDLGMAGDTTTMSLVAIDARGSGDIVARQDCTVSGTRVAESIFQSFDGEVNCDIKIFDGQSAEKGDVVIHIEGLYGEMLSAERTALNFMQRMSGVATLTAEYKKAVKGLDVKLLDTRKTLPGYRMIDKFAVLCGGGMNHRMGLYDKIMIKDNHVAHWTSDAKENLADAVHKARSRYPDLEIEAEADTVEQVKQLLEAKPDWILLDNMSLDELRECVALCKGISLTEASGGVNLSTVREIAETGVDAVSIGALTHSAVAVDLALDKTVA